jgi:hypothetical protein
MMGECRVRQEALFYEFSPEGPVPAGHLLRSIDRFVELDGLRPELAPFFRNRQICRHAMQRDRNSVALA